MRLKLNENHLIFGGTAVIAILLIVVFGFSGSAETGPGIEDREAGVIKFDDGQTAPNASNITHSMARPEGPINIQYRGEPFWREFRVISYYMNYSSTLPVQRPGPDGELETKMQALYNIYPDDGVINGYIVPVYQNETDRFRADIYIDQDFRDEVEGPVHIAYGNGSFSAIREYNFSEPVFEGLYKDSVYFHNVEAIRYDVQDPSVAVGNFTADDLNPDSDGYIAFYLR